ncbi:TniQ family protein [Pseudomonas sp. ES3-33]|uniref:TniQ family protein n=1 Tax=Pseudomonas sp. ES3-33 TaxID=1628833 RepID=UPI0009E356BE|nr:TniQ family protein [Pseudomonas sp. ES3-33]
MNKLCYIPKPAEFESPKSLLMRMAHYNGFGTVSNMCTYFASIPHHWSDLLGQSSPLLDIVDKQAPLLAGDLRRVFYSILPQPRSFKVDNIYLPRGACGNSLRYCPQCIDAARSPIFHDLPDLEVCLLHGIVLVSSCPHCHTKELWHHAQLVNCRCGFQRSAACRVIGDFMPAVADPFESHQVVEEISSKYALSKLCASLWDARRRADNHSCCILPLQVIEHIEMTVASQVARYPGFIRSLHMAPWINSGTASVAWLANRALHRLYTDNSSCQMHDCCRFATISRRNMLRAVFGDEREDVETVLDYNLDRWMEQQSPDHYNATRRCQIIRQANAGYCPAYQRSAENLAGLTKDEVATLLQCSLSTVDRLQNQGWFVRPVQAMPIRSFLPDVLDRTATEQFAKQYILLDELCTLLGLPTYLGDHLMRTAGIRLINPFFEPKLYHRATVFVMLGHLQRHHLVCETDTQQSTNVMAPATFGNIQYTFILTGALRKTQPNYTSYQMQNYVRPITAPSDIERAAADSHLFNINEVFEILRTPLTDGLKALLKVGIDLQKLPHVSSRYSLLDIEIIRDIIGST